jgi:synaptotagmin-like protein
MNFQGEMTGKREEPSSESEMKYSYSTDVDDYKLVFISSDSSGKEDDYDDSSSTTSSATKCSIVLDECDWDYFEPSATNAKSLLKDFTSSTFSPFGSPSLYRRRFNSSPLSSPLSYRRGMSESPYSVRKSDTGTDEEIINIESSSPTSSEGFLPDYLKAWKKNHKCKDKKHACKCGPHYVAIPVPILVPMDTFQNWNSSGNSDLLQLWNTSSNLLYQHDNKTDVTNTPSSLDAQHPQQVETTTDGEEKEKKRQKISDVSIKPNVSCTSSALPPRRSLRSLSCDTSDSDKVDNETDKRDGGHKSASKFRKSTNEINKQNNINTFAGASNITHLNETIKITSKHETNTCDESSGCVSTPYTSNNLIKTTASSCNSNAIQTTSCNSGTMISVGKLKAPENGANDGYLVSESVFSSSDDESGDEKSSKIVQRSYDVAGAAQVDNIVAHGSSDSSNRSPAGTSETDASDSEDTGIDDRRSKSKRFTKVFVVNKNAPTSESDSCSSINAIESSSSDDADSSDNDADTDGITLNYMKPLEQEENNGHDSTKSHQEIVLNYIRPIGEGVDELVVLNSIKTIDNEISDNEIDDKTVQHSDENETESEKVNGASENVVIEVDDKNKSTLPSANDDDKRHHEVSDELNVNEIEEICDSLEATNIANEAEIQETATDGDKIEINKETHKTSSCNLSMILNDSRATDDKKVHIDHDDVRTGSADDENSLKIESPLNDHISIDVDEKEKQHISTELVSDDLQTLIVNNDSVPTNETGFHQHTNESDVLPLYDRTATSSGNNNTISENNSCVKQNVNEETAKELLSVENCVGGLVSSQRSNPTDGNGKFTSLIMITQQDKDDNFIMNKESESHVNVISTDTTQIVTANSTRDAIVVQHKNWQPGYPTNVTNGASVKSKIGFYEENINKVSGKKLKVEPTSDDEKILNKKAIEEKNKDTLARSVDNDDVKVITSNDTLSAVVCLEDGLADDDSWVEDVSQQDSEEFATETGSEFDSSDEMTLTAMDREEELRGYNRVSIDFTLHTIVEESCEESEYEAGERKSQRISASELEKYFFFGLGDGNPSSHNAAKTYDDHDDSPSETSSVCSEGLDSLNGPDDTLKNADETLASSRLEKYFLSGFMGFSADGADGSDGSGSVGSDSEGRPSPEQRRKKLVRARGTGRSHSSSLDNLLSKEESIDNPSEAHQLESDNSSETDTCDDTTEKTESHCDTVKRKKKLKKLDHDDSINKKTPDVEIKDPSESDNDEEGRKTPQPEFLMPASSNLVHSRKQHSRDSGFIGSNDDLLKSDGQKSPEMKMELEEIQEEIKEAEQSIPDKTPPPTNLTRKDSFNAWSSDEETNLMMSKMRQFFKSLVAASANTRNSKSTPATEAPLSGTPKARQRSPQLVYFENELTRLMKTVPGIKDEQVRELVEYFSSEDTWSDSYDSSDYTSSDKESAVRKSSKIQQQISASCQEIIQKFDNGKAGIPDEEGDMGDGGLLDDGLNKETAFVYQKLVASISKIADEKPAVPIDITNSPPIIAKVMHHIGSRLVALMHEVSSGESLKSNSPKQATRYHRRVQAKISATTTEDDGSTSESNFEDPMTNNLPRSKSHDLLLGDAKPAPDTMTGEEREASDYERYSWRGSFESALLTNCDSRQKLSTLDNSTSALSILAAKRRSAGDLLFSPKSLSREQLDRVRSCGSIGGAGDHDLENSKLWESTQSQESSRRRSGVLEDDTDESSDNDHQLHARSTLPRSLQTSSITASTTNSLPRLPTSSSNIQASSSGAMQKAQSVYQFLQNNVKSARYRAPGFNNRQQPPKRALSAPGLQPLAPRRDRRSKVQSLAMGEFERFASQKTF